MKKVSIIMPTYRRIDQTITSIRLLKQSNGWNSEFTPEIIIADSTPDKSLQVALEKEFGREIIYTRPERDGIATNKNQGASVAKNPVLIFCDSDIEVEKDTIVNTIRSLESHPTAAGIGGQVIWKGGNLDSSRDRPRPEDRTATVVNTTYIEAIYSRYFATYRRVFFEVGGYDETVFNMRGEGSDLSIRYWRSGFPLVFDDSIHVHHVHEVSDSAALRGEHPEWGIAKDLLLLAYKYDMIPGDYPNFQKTIAANFGKEGVEGYWRLLQGIVRHYDFITDVKKTLDSQKKAMKPQFDFKFLEVFSQNEFFKQCIEEAEERLKPFK